MSGPKKRPTHLIIPRPPVWIDRTGEAPRSDPQRASAPDDGARNSDEGSNDMDAELLSILEDAERNGGDLLSIIARGHNEDRPLRAKLSALLEGGFLTMGGTSAATVMTTYLTPAGRDALAAATKKAAA